MEKIQLVKLPQISQAIMQASRLVAILAPLQLGLGVQMHHFFQSKLLVDSLHQHGYACSYSEVKKFERSASVTQGTELSEAAARNCIQYSYDNVDHNLRTLDGKGTFHGMGIIAMVTPGAQSQRQIPRVNVTGEDIARVEHKHIQQFLSEREVFLSFCFLPPQDPDGREPSARVDLL